MIDTSNTLPSAMSIRDQFLNQLYMGIPKKIIDSLAGYVKTQEYYAEIEKYGQDAETTYNGLCAIAELAPTIADYVAYEMSSIKYSEISDDAVNAEKTLTPLSNVDGFKVLKSLSNSEIRYAISDMTSDPDVSFEIYNSVKEDSFDDFKKLVKDHGLSTIQMNKKLGIINLSGVILEQASEVAQQTSTKKIQEIDLDDSIHIPSILKSARSQETKNLLAAFDTGEVDNADNPYPVMCLLTRVSLSQILTIVESINPDSPTLSKYEQRVLCLKQMPGFKFIVDSDIKSIDENTDINDLQASIEAMGDYTEALSQQEQTNGVRSNENEVLRPTIHSAVHLDFPSRLRDNPAPNKIFTDHHEAILKGIYRLYGNMFEDMTQEDFVYLFGGSRFAPETYTPPFYWSGEENTFKAIIRVLYTPQPSALRKLVLSSSDKAEGMTEHDWGRNKNKVAYLNVENNIQEIVKQIAGVDLKSL